MKISKIRILFGNRSWTIVSSKCPLPKDINHNTLFSFAFILILLSIFSSNVASAADYSALTRNSVLESASLNQALQSINKGKQLATQNNSELMDKKIKEKAKELEGVFLSVMIQPMFPDGKHSDLFGGGTGQDVYRTLMIQQYGKVLADAGGVGLTNNIEKELKQRK